MFTLDLSPSYSWPVTLQLAADGGEFQEFTFDVQLKRLEQDRIREILQPAEGKALTDEDACRELVMGWSGISDKKGADLPFSEAALAKLLKVHGAPGAIVKAWLDSINPEAKDTGKRRPRT